MADTQCDSLVGERSEPTPTPVGRDPVRVRAEDEQELRDAVTLARLARAAA